MSDEALRALERRFKESGFLEDEAAYFFARVRAGMNGSGLDEVALSVTMHRLVQAGYSLAEAEKLFSSPSLPQAILELIRRHKEPQPEPEPPQGEFADEEVESDLGYPPEFRFRTPAEQLEVWRQHFLGLDASQVEELASRELPEGAESWAVIPKPSRIVAGSYHEALEKMLSIIVEQRPFRNWREGQLDPDHLRLTQSTQAWLNELERDQPGDFLVFPFQLGLRHRGRSIRRARAVFSSDEIGLGPYEVAALLVTHPDRITGYDQLYGIDCAGCEYDSEGAGAFPACLGMHWHDDRLSLSCCSLGDANQNYGAASAFRSQ